MATKAIDVRRLRLIGLAWWHAAMTIRAVAWLTVAVVVLSVAMSRSPRLSTVEDHARRAGDLRHAARRAISRNRVGIVVASIVSIGISIGIAVRIAVVAVGVAIVAIRVATIRVAIG